MDTQKDLQFEPLADILLVDDTPANLKVLSEILKSSHYGVRAVPSGKMALKAVSLSAPDLILMDINMPDMNGYELCRKLKSSPDFGQIPVIFISALDDVEDKVNAFREGGVDFISKPFQIEEVLMRVKTHLTIRRLQTELEQKNQALETQVQQLQNLEHLRDILTSMIVHDLRIPLTGLSSNLELISDFTKQLPQPVKRFLRLARTSTQNLLGNINQLLELNRLEAGKKILDYSRFELRALLLEVLGSFEFQIQEQIVSVDYPSEPLWIEADQNLIQRVLLNLLGNAFRYTPFQGLISVNWKKTEDAFWLEVIDQGPGISEQYHQKIFEKFGQAEIKQNAKEMSSGLGLAFCKLAIEAHGGKIGVKSQAGQGCSLWFEIPAAAF
ncbi:hybrid sensor histidine kinase/response regulator [bacterium (Candidatus Blackallbacteria) CG17_big_fil_post_rev_8_21_14_2_50_48_46]|uniref:histidine kinase n=1 Tax=bacterium (Candidatus Blackallbacteria) CG17_big_fil_post_rev_8_21_14_2_50_48_46 TaxID=2014261 RepID=A0A2M7G1J9_9BACT|nr:MAG: hybrid sensor histidine kinase/response regulator [bacterium (Candidatus Blackallbacteria) CG18_big_fil_WC_8_21_14_2_50_49_26]PIW15606.1 MAG: hybrid sensor histidine kinase/response regulator [bacterium (Candidatus Blackallbacteria) CG17_big_fil_post_rev_8_21_14_2_50_48_46]PIW49397.1 MAG: hybrid sensor histidine kinase/response regulator [bacterium (Candidatus Blackallbacteria) CG13_big_fil_rev_8_21_14_2_50_49_14]